MTGLAVNHPAYRGLHRLVAHGGAVGILEPRSEKVLHLEEALRRLHVLPRDGAADGRHMDTDCIGDLGHDQRLQRTRPLTEKLLLTRDDLVADRQEGLLTLLQAAHEEAGAADLLPEVEKQLLVLTTPGQQFLVFLVDLQARKLLLVQADKEPVLPPLPILLRDNDQIGDDTLLLGFRKGTPRVGFERGDQPRRGGNIGERHTQLPRNLLVAVPRQLLQVMAENSCRQTVSLPAPGQLEKQAIGKIASPDTGRLESADLFHHAFDRRFGNSGGTCQLLGRCSQVAVLIKAPRDQLDQRKFLIGKTGGLIHDMAAKRGSRSTRFKKKIPPFLVHRRPVSRCGTLGEIIAPLILKRNTIARFCG